MSDGIKFFAVLHVNMDKRQAVTIRGGDRDALVANIARYIVKNDITDICTSTSIDNAGDTGPSEYASVELTTVDAGGYAEPYEVSTDGGVNSDHFSSLADAAEAFAQAVRQEGAYDYSCK